MRRNARDWLVGGLVGSMVGAGLIFAADASWFRRPDAVPQVEVVKAAVEVPVLTARTGDAFWGLHVEGVIPCSSMLVRGGGHLVILTRNERPLDKCSYHVKGKKKVFLDDRKFVLSVVGDDMIHVERIVETEPAESEVAAEPLVEPSAGPEQIAAGQ